jgi:hypothetical protein
MIKIRWVTRTEPVYQDGLPIGHGYPYVVLQYCQTQHDVPEECYEWIDVPTVTEE